MCCYRVYFDTFPSVGNLPNKLRHRPPLGRPEQVDGRIDPAAFPRATLSPPSLLIRR
jgi:hypothetical protein